ncbi:MAG: zinc-binding dehydrogenase [Acidimicrobiales bacterium]|jgi:threonine dehydrogenase-like Zn-dependent dehydrogenase|nr:zinc-binding dehydrogenase [Acidimicrobiales bacterium]
MKQIMLHGADDWRLDDVPEPVPGPRDALVRIAACGICGTDVSYIHMGMTPGHPIPLGHEMAGVVEWVGDDVVDVAVGDRVVVCPSDAGDGPMGTGGPQGGLTPLLHVPDAASGRRLFAVPDDMALTTAALAEPLAVGMQAVNQSEARPGEKVVVFGCGPIGLMALATLADRGVDDVVAVDLSPARLELARTVGAAHVLDPGVVDVWEELKRIHGTTPFMFGPTPATDVYIEASGADRVIGDVLQHGRVDGRLVVVALHYRPVPTNYVNVLMKQFTIRGSMEYPERFEDAIELLERRDLSGLVTHTLGLEEFGAGLAVLEGSKDCGKVMITMGDHR